MINNKLIEIMDRGYSFSYKEEANDIINIGVSKMDTDQLNLSNSVLITKDRFKNEEEVYRAVMEAASRIHNLMHLRSVADIKNCSHNYVYIADGRYQKRICIFCRGNFGYKVTQTVEIPLN